MITVFKKNSITIFFIFILLAYQEEQHAKRREKLLKNSQKKAVEIADDPIHNDFKREMLFYRQGQATVLSALEIFRAKKIPTKRPEDYFAQMFKTDEHMQVNYFNLTKFLFLQKNKQ